MSHIKLLKFDSLVNMSLTFGLVLFAGLSTCENRNLINLQYKQFVLSNAPNIRIFADESKPKFEDNYFYLMWKIDNSGRGLKNIKTKCIIIYNQELDSNGKIKYNNHIYRDINLQSINENVSSKLRVDTNDLISVNDIKNSVESKLNYNIIMVMFVNYTIPKELSLNNSEINERLVEYYMWIPKVNRFELVNQDLKNIVFDYLIEKHLI